VLEIQTAGQMVCRTKEKLWFTVSVEKTKRLGEWEVAMLLARCVFLSKKVETHG
jgi:hypothetical protein